MTDVKRYDPGDGWNEHMVVSADGSYVEYEDYASLRKELEEKELALTAANERARVAEEELHERWRAMQVLERELEDSNMERYQFTTQNMHLIKLLRKKPEMDMDALIAAFCMVYTSPAWGGDERTPQGWERKETALRKAFASTSHNVNDKLVAAEKEVEKALSTCRMILRERDEARAELDSLRSSLERAKGEIAQMKEKYERP